ncbi:substrate-binding domain-containing protein [Paraburkholderia sp. CNPSo 3281]|uniref:substrate-binding domain-containing protein n=1 Tax=Paraburkholderia sp. CNPSo 3281 TaxID=2940933 RepID=UPI0020B77631|nr:substrate-binding domain-containing protein [Paraburkholderia sp. CNPSo 3281]MCP3715858.1 substrate-binding domain-containing protein [Paraburkholderia sp. CNPSo 3281]
MGIRELAKVLKLSVSTVSRALNDSDEVSAETRERVRAAALEHGYAPSKSAASLRRGRLDIVGLMLPVRREEETYTLGIFMKLADGLQSVLSRHGMDLVMYSSESWDDEFARLRRIVDRRHVDGVILAGTRRHDERLDYVASRHFPFVALGRSESGGKHAWVDLDFEAAATEGVERLVAQGHRRIALAIPGGDAMQAHIYLHAWKKAMKKHGLPVPEGFVQRNELSERGGYLATEALLKLGVPPDALMFQSDCMAIGAYRKLHETGRAPGRDLAISGGVLAGEVSEYLAPRLSGFTLDAYGLGQRLAQALLAQFPDLGDTYRAAREPLLWPLTLRERDDDTVTSEAVQR